MAKTSEPSRERVLLLYEEGHRQAAIARELAITRERVRQILDHSAVNKRTAEEQREADFRLATRGREGEIEKVFWETRDFVAVESRLDLDPSSVRRVLEDLWPDVEVFREVQWGEHQQFTDAQLLSALRDAASSSGMASPMTVGDYDAWVASGSQDARPARVTIMSRFGGWRPALIEAGLPANEPTRGPGQFTLDACIAALARAWRDIGEPPSMARYQAWHEAHTGTPGGDMVRARARNWGTAKVAAYSLVHGKAPPVVRTADEARHGKPVTPTVGRAYRAREVAEWHSPEQIQPADPAVIERGVRSHFNTEAALAKTVEEAGLVPLSPTGSDPPFDLAWRQHDVLFVVEVKSATALNLEGQVRLGFGQILRYCEELRLRGEEARAILALELTPAPIWSLVADRVGVCLVHPDAPLVVGTA